jgi:hypothetical protein
MPEEEKVVDNGVKPNRFWNAWHIQQGACNPSGVARSLVEAIDEVRAENPNTDNVRQDSAVRQICHQLAFILGVGDPPYLDYHKDYETCREKAVPPIKR